MKSDDVGLLLPPGVENERLIDQALAGQMPLPQGYKILCMVPPAKKEFEGTGIVKSDLAIQNEELSTVVLFVIKLGADAYADKAKFPSGPYCKEGDFVMCRAYAGTRVKLHGKEFRVISDDQVECTVLDPRGLQRA